jgi:hypothetical protein
MVKEVLSKHRLASVRIETSKKYRSGGQAVVAGASIAA